MTDEGAAEQLKLLREYGNDAHLHPVTRRVAVWMAERWWYVAGGSFERPSLIAAEDQAPGPRRAG